MGTSSLRACILSLFLAVVLLPGLLRCEQPRPGIYKPPALTLERLMQQDAAPNGASLWALAAHPADLRALMEAHAASGQLLAQLFLGEASIPPECTSLPFKTAPADCPDDPAPENLLGLPRAFDLAIHWLTLASRQGSGEASEILAQAMERAIRSPAPSRYSMADVAREHARARSQGYDLQDVEYSCYRLAPGHLGGRLVMAAIPEAYQLTPPEQAALQAAGVSGTLSWGSAGTESGLSTLLRHPEGPKIRIRVILGRAATHEMRLPMADRASVLYLQNGDRMVTVPPAYPELRRQIAFRPPAAGESAGAAFQHIDGSFASGCDSPALPLGSGLP